MGCVKVYLTQPILFSMPPPDFNKRSLHGLSIADCFELFSFKETVARYPKGQVLLVLLWGFAECGNRKALRLKAQGVYSCK